MMLLKCMDYMSLFLFLLFQVYVVTHSQKKKVYVVTYKTRYLQFSSLSYLYFQLIGLILHLLCFIQKIIEKISDTKLNRTQLFISNNPIGVGSLANAVESFLDI